MIKRIAAIGEISDADAMQLLDRNEDEFYQYLFYTSARYIKALEEPKFRELRQILDSDETPEKLVNEFNKYMRKSENVRKLQRVFPIIITTCISAHKIGEPEPLFDMTIMDEASQCNVAISLVPIIRGEKTDASGRSATAKSGYSAWRIDKQKASSQVSCIG